MAKKSEIMTHLLSGSKFQKTFLFTLANASINVPFSADFLSFLVTFKVISSDLNFSHTFLIIKFSCEICRTDFFVNINAITRAKRRSFRNKTHFVCPWSSRSFCKWVTFSVSSCPPSERWNHLKIYRRKLQFNIQKKIRAWQRIRSRLWLKRRNLTSIGYMFFDLTYTLLADRSVF